MSGKAPTTDDEVVIDRSTAQKHHFAIGDRVRILLPNGHHTFTISGIMTFGSANSLAGATLTAFYLPTAQQLFNSVGHYDTINVLVKSGADKVAVQREIQRVLPADVEVVSGQTVANELDQTIQHDLSFLSTALLIFAFISLLVGSFTIFNTFSITVGQRTRELALLRVVGASRRQIFGSVLSEAALTGLIASLIGLGLGVVAAIGLKALLGRLWDHAAVGAARVQGAHADRGADRRDRCDHALGDRAGAPRRADPASRCADRRRHRPNRSAGNPARWSTGIIAALLGLLLVVSGIEKARIGSVGLGALCVFIATVVLVPAIAGPLASALGRPLAHVLGVPGRLGRRNSARNPRRTAQTAGALMIGLALVSTIGVLGSSLSTSAKDEVNSALAADYIIGGSDSISPTVAKIAARLPGAAATTVVYTGQFDVRGSLQSLGAASTAGVEQDRQARHRRRQGAAAMARGELLVDTNTAKTKHLHVGSVVPVTFAADGTNVDARRRDLQVQPARRQLPDRSRLLPRPTSITR